MFLLRRTYRVIGSSPVRGSASRGYLACRKCDRDIEPEEAHWRKAVGAEFLSLDGVLEFAGDLRKRSPRSFAAAIRTPRRAQAHDSPRGGGRRQTPLRGLWRA